MSRLREIEGHLHTLQEIRGILRAMRNLALLETQKLARVSSAQRLAIERIEAVAADFLTWFPTALERPTGTRPLYVLIGSERGFCGDFNEAVRSTFLEHHRAHPTEDPLLILMGTRLSSRSEDLPPVSALMEGPSVTEDIPAVMSRLADQLRSLQSQYHVFCVLDTTVIHHTSTDGHSEVNVRQPFLGLQRQSPHYAFPPLLNLLPRAFTAELIDHYLFAILQEVLYSSLLAENQRRLSHMEQASQRLDRTMGDLTLKHHTFRQEDITEEIETIMLSAEFLRRR